MSGGKKIAVIDGNSWTHRAYHAVPPVMKLADGTPTNAVHGFMNMFLSFYSKAQPDAIICAFDAGIPQFRLEAVEQYKAQRKPMDNELRVQFPIVEELLKCMDIPVVKVEGWEGDDILGTIAKKCEDKGYESLLITGDKDANQLASKLTKIVNMKKGVSDVVLYGPEEVYEKYGVKVEQFIDFLALMGDSSDNIPGVPGIGPKSATDLLQKFGSLEGIYDNLDQLKGKQLENIRDNKDSAYISRQAATISMDVPIDIDLDNICFPSFDKDKVSEVFLRYSMRSALTGVLALIGESPEENAAEDNLPSNNKSVNPPNISQNNFKPAISNKEKPEINYENFKESDDAKETFDNFINQNRPFAIAIANKIDDAPAQASIFDVDDSDKYKYPEYKNLQLAISDNNDVAIIEADEAVDFLKKLHNINVDIIAENAKDVFEITYSGNWNFLKNTNLYDISLAAYVLNSSKSEYSAVDAYTQVFGEMLPTLDANIDSSVKKTDEIYIDKKNKNLRLNLARRASICFVIKDYLNDLLEECKLTDIYNKIEIPLTKVLTDIQFSGAKVDVFKLKDLSISITKTIESLQSEILDLAGTEFNIDSPKQLGHILFEVLALPAKKKTKTGYSTDAAVLADLATMHPLPAKVIQYREFAKLKSTYIDVLPKIADKNNLVHTSFHQKVTTTGRLSSSDPNLQNIPTRSEFGNRIRECFIPHSENELFLTADYSQIELRVLAHLSQDKGLIDAFNSGGDFHANTASTIFNVDKDKVDSNMRRTAKAVNFGIVYGQQAFGLSQTLGIPVSEAKEMIDTYFKTFPGVRKYLDDTVQQATINGYASTMFGRRRYIPELNGSNKRFVAFGQRTAMNHPMQGTAADIIKIAMIDVVCEMYKQNMKSRCILQVHDELDFSVAKDELDALTSLVKDKMENAVALDVPLKVDVASGDNWAMAK